MGGGTADTAEALNNASRRGAEKKLEAAAAAVVVVMGATGAGKSRLAVDLASRFPAVEVLNADSMQVYRGLDVLTNKLPLSDQKGVPHHLLGTVDPSHNFTAKDFRDLAIPIIDGILSRGGLPVIVGGTNYYIQALVSPYLIDDVVDDIDMEGCSPIPSQGPDTTDSLNGFERLKEIDPVAANRIHPNDHRKINRYLSLYARSGVLPSNLFQEKSAGKWGRADNFRYNCCFIWVDASLPVLDNYVNQRVDCMIDVGLLNEVYSIYYPSADYTRGLRQAIGVREFEDFFKFYMSSAETGLPCLEKTDGDCDAEARINTMSKTYKGDKALRPNSLGIFGSSDIMLNAILDEAIYNLKANTRRLVRRQKRRLNRLKTFFGWDLHYIDATEAILCKSEGSWQAEVVEPSFEVINTFLSQQVGSLAGTETLADVKNQHTAFRDLWTQYTCEACGNRILRGAHEWEQHKQGRSHRKRILGLKKKKNLSFCLVPTTQPTATEDSA